MLQTVSQRVWYKHQKHKGDKKSGQEKQMIGCFRREKVIILKNCPQHERHVESGMVQTNDVLTRNSQSVEAQLINYLPTLLEQQRMLNRGTLHLERRNEFSHYSPNEPEQGCPVPIKGSQQKLVTLQE